MVQRVPKWEGGIARVMSEISQGGTASTHFLIRLNSLSRRASISARACWFSCKASSTACTFTIITLESLHPTFHHAPPCTAHAPKPIRDTKSTGTPVCKFYSKTISMKNAVQPLLQDLLTFPAARVQRPWYTAWQPWASLALTYLKITITWKSALLRTVIYHQKIKLAAALRSLWKFKNEDITSGVTSISKSAGSNTRLSSMEYRSKPSVVAAANDLPVGQSWRLLVRTTGRALLLPVPGNPNPNLFWDWRSVPSSSSLSSSSIKSSGPALVMFLEFRKSSTPSKERLCVIWILLSSTCKTWQVALELFVSPNLRSAQHETFYLSILLPKKIKTWCFSILMIEVHMCRNHEMTWW